MHRIAPAPPAACLAALAAALLAAPAAAQEGQVAREQFVFIGDRLTIDVDVNVAGTLRLIRGADGHVRVAGRAQDGFTSSGLSDDERLTLTAAGAGPVDYLVSVPENVRVHVRLPGPATGRSLGRGRTGSWEWGASEARQAEIPEWLPGLSVDGSWDASLYTTFTREWAPAEISVPDLSVVTRVAVRLEGWRFRVITTRPLGVVEGNSASLVIRPAGPPMEVVLSLPADTRDFTLRLGGRTALRLDSASVTTFCTPVTEQRLSNDRRWFTFNPLDGSLDCTGDAVQRHGG